MDSQASKQGKSKDHGYIVSISHIFLELYNMQDNVELNSHKSQAIAVTIKDVRAHCYCASLLRTPFIKHPRATSFSSARTESKTQQKQRAGDLGVNLVCQYFCWMLGDPQFFFGRSLPFPILSSILKNKKNLCVGSLNYFS